MNLEAHNMHLSLALSLNFWSHFSLLSFRKQLRSINYVASSSVGYKTQLYKEMKDVYVDVVVIG